MTAETPATRKLTVTKTFDFYHDGIRPTKYVAGETYPECLEEAAAYAHEHGLGVMEDPGVAKALTVPANKDKGPAPENKGSAVRRGGPAVRRGKAEE